VPEGHPEALHGKTFVLTGVLDSLYRETAADLIKKHSGKVTQVRWSDHLCYVITGVLDSLYRETAADLIKKHSGKVKQVCWLLMFVWGSKARLVYRSAS